MATVVMKNISVRTVNDSCDFLSSAQKILVWLCLPWRALAARQHRCRMDVAHRYNPVMRTRPIATLHTTQNQTRNLETETTPKLSTDKSR